MRSRLADTTARWLSPAALDLAEGLLFFDPKRRLSAVSALKTAYFTTEQPEMEVPSQYVVLPGSSKLELMPQIGQTG